MVLGEAEAGVGGKESRKPRSWRHATNGGAGGGDGRSELDGGLFY